MCRILALLVLLLLSGVTTVNADDRDRDRRSQKPATQQMVQPQLIQVPAVPRDRQEQRRRVNAPTQAEPSNSSELLQVHTVSFDRFKLRADSPTEYQFEQMQTLSFQDDETSQTEEEKNIEQSDIAAEELQQEQIADVVAESTRYEEETAAEEYVAHAGNGQFTYKIIEEDNRIVVLQVDAVSVNTVQTQ